MIVTRKEISSTQEDKIVIGMVMSSKFIREVAPIYEPEFLLNSFARIVCEWVISYYEKYDVAPKYQIKDIFDEQKENLEKAEEQIISQFLTKLSKLYSEQEEINEDYFIDLAMNYITKRKLEITHSKVGKLLENGMTKEAEEEYIKYDQVSRITSKWFDSIHQTEMMDSFNDQNEAILQMSGQFGKFLGPLERGWLVSIAGAFKVGKTHLMQEFMIQAATERLKVASISLEMKRSTRNKRLYKRIASLPDEEGLVTFPCFDCLSNQNDTCDLKERKNRRSLSVDGTTPIYSPDMQYKPCFACRSKRPRPLEFSVTTWFDSIEKKAFTLKTAMKAIKQFKSMWGNNIRMISYPRFSATLADIKRDLDQLVNLENFIPDVIIIDYAGIIKPERAFAKDYMALDTIWKGLSGLAEERHALVVTGSQLERSSLRKDSGDADVAGLAGWIGQAADVDLEFVLNQTPEDKAKGLIRVNKLVDRNHDFNKKDTCFILQHLGTGQVIIDSEIVREYFR
jgi:replicative DNA helicase